MESPQKPNRFQTSLIVGAIISSLLIGGLFGYFYCYATTSEEFGNLEKQISLIQEQLSNIEKNLEDTVSYSELYEQVDNLQSQVTSLKDEISNPQSTILNTSNITGLQDQLDILQEEIITLQQPPNVTEQDINQISSQIDDLAIQLETLQQQINDIQAYPSNTYQNITYILYENISLSELFDQVRESVVIVQARITEYDFFGHPYYYQVQGSGFVYYVNGQMVILTNYHVIEDSTSINVTFVTGNIYPASILGSDQNKDLAVLLAEAPENEYKPLEFTNSSKVRVGDPVIVVGTPYGLAGSMSEGIVSALNRTLETNDYAITNVIQTTAPINPGNSGGPLLNYQGQVLGIVTAIIQDSQGIGFAIPSDIILEAIGELLT